MNTTESIKWFCLIMGIYIFLSTVGATVMFILYDICKDLEELWESRKK